MRGAFSRSRIKRARRLTCQIKSPPNTATATKDGSSYTIKGTATGIDTANPMQPVNKPFEIDVTCP